MKKALIALAAAAALLLTVAAPGTAEAQGRAERQFFRALGIGAAVVGGALLFGHAARAHIEPRYHAYAPVKGYYYHPSYRARPVASCPGGFWSARPIAFDRWGQPSRWSKARWVCPPRGYHSSHYYYRR